MCRQGAGNGVLNLQLYSEVSYDEAVDLAEYDRLTGVVADG